MSSMMETLIRQAARPRGAVGRILVHIWGGHFAPMAAWALEGVDRAAGAHLLDVGCGGGTGVRQALARFAGVRVTAVDTSEVALAATERANRAAVRGGSVTLQVADAMALPFADGSFDCVLALQTHIYWPAAEQGFAEIARVLRPGGCLILACEQDKLDHHLQDLCTSAQTAAALRRAGFAAAVDSAQRSGWRRWVARAAGPRRAHVVE